MVRAECRFARQKANGAAGCQRRLRMRGANAVPEQGHGRGRLSSSITTAGLVPDIPVLSPSPSLSLPSQTRAIVLLAVAGFAGQSMVRSADSLLPQIAADFSVTVGAASIIVSVYSLMHGSMQLVIGPIGDRFGKYVMIATMCALSAVTVAACGFAQTLG